MVGDVEMQNEYDFTDGKRGKHYKEYRKGHKVIVSQEDGSEVVHYFSKKEGSVIIDPDLKPYYPDDDSVNRALRSLVRS